MIHLTQAQHDELVAAAARGAAHRAETPEELLAQAQALVARAAALRCVLTIEQRPLLPLAMGNYETVAEVRPARA